VRSAAPRNVSAVRSARVERVVFMPWYSRIRRATSRSPQVIVLQCVTGQARGLVRPPLRTGVRKLGGRAPYGRARPCCTFRSS
jgi:hypothetical protein